MSLTFQEKILNLNRGSNPEPQALEIRALTINIQIPEQLKTALETSFSQGSD